MTQWNQFCNYFHQHKITILGAMSFNNIFQNAFVHVVAGGGPHIDLFQQACTFCSAMAVVWCTHTHTHTQPFQP